VPPVAHDTPALKAARAASNHDGESALHSADVVALHARLLAEAAEPANVAQLHPQETPHHRWHRARALEAALARNEVVSADELMWLGGYREGPEYRGFKLTYGDAETKSPAGAGQV
jgi:hypothetical protein